MQHMTKYILASGYRGMTENTARSFRKEIFGGIEKKTIKILDCFFAQDKSSWSERFERDKVFFVNQGYDLSFELAEIESFVEQIKQSDVVIFQGGHARVMEDVLSKISGWKESLAGKVVIGSSAGADNLVRHYGVGKTMRIGDGYGLIPIKFIPHFQSDAGVDWSLLAKRLEDYKDTSLETVYLKDGEYKVFEF
jgi:peptidase E